MKIRIHSLFLMTTFILSAGAMAQSGGLAPDQNPNYMIARDKYLTIADSVIAFHGTTVQDTYRAIDFLADRREAREQRRLFRQTLRLERARNGNYYYNDYYTPYNYNYNNLPYYNGYRSYRYGRWNGNYYYRNSFPTGWWWYR